MGFGYLFLGYLFAFLLEITANVKPLGAGPLAVLLGCVLMLIGIFKLSDFEKSFRISAVPVGLLLFANVFHDIEMVGAWIGKTPEWMSENVTAVFGWIDFVAILLFHALLLPAIARLAMSVELPKTATAATRNLILVGLWGVLYLCASLIPFPETVKKGVLLAQVLSNFIVLLLNLWLFLSCMKNIAPEEDADQPPRRYRWNFLNRVGDRFTSEHERAAEKKRMEIQDFLRRRKERKEERKNRKK